MAYKEDYKTDDPAWYGKHPTSSALTGKDVALQFKKLSESAKVPEYKSEEAAGMDLCANAFCIIPTGSHAIVPTGLAMSLPKGYEAQVRPRSGLAAKHAVTVLNSPGTIDSDYRGEIKVILINHGKSAFEINPGDRIAQMVIAAVVRPVVRTVEKLGETARGSGGLGSTGMK